MSVERPAALGLGKLALHLLVDPNTGMSRCGSGPGASQAEEEADVTCRKCKRLARLYREAAIDMFKFGVRGTLRLVQ